MNQELFYRIALTRVPNIGPVQARLLLQHFSPAEIFRVSEQVLEKMDGIGTIRAGSIRSFSGFKAVEKEIRFIEDFRIRPLFISDPAYPQRLLNCYDAPTLLYFKGSTDLNAGRMIAVIGTRNMTDYGRQLTENLLAGLSSPDMVVVSGLAFGIDAVAHRSAIKNGLPTVAVLAHGLDQIYPPEHGSLAREMLDHGGGLLSEFGSSIKPDRHNFPSRNRIVAGMTDATIVIETGEKGGSIITATLANGYNRDVFAFPGRVNDPKSKGCNELIRTNRAVLLTCAEDLLELMGWQKQLQKKRPVNPQRSLFVELSPEEKIVVRLLEERQPRHIDDIYLQSRLSNSTVAATLLNLELKNMLSALPGKLYTLH